MAKSLLELGVNTGQWDAGLKKAQSALDSFVQANGGLQNALAKDDQKIQTFVQMMGKMESTATTAKGKMNDYKRSIEVLTEQYKLLSAAQQKGVEGMTYMKSIDQITMKYRAAAAEVQKLNASLNVSNVAGGGGLGIGASIGSAFKMLGPAALAAGGVMAAMNGLKSAMSDMVQINMQFEQASANLAAVIGKTRDQTTALTEQAKQLGATTQYTAVQITDLQTNLARLGFTESEILNSTKAVQALATATGADLGEAANLAGAALRGFGLNAAEMERVASVLAVSTTKSALSFEKLATALPTVAPVAKQFGFSIEDTVTLLGKLSDAGLDASTAGTATRKILLNLADANGKLAQALGRPVSNVEELGEALVQLKEKGLDLNKMLELTDVRSVTAFATFVDNAATLRDFKNSITDCSDALQSMVDEQLNTLQGSVTIMKSAWEGLLISFSNSNGILKSLTDELTRLLTAWTEARKRIQGGEGAIGLYMKDLTNEQRERLKNQVEEKRAAGATDEAIKRGAEQRLSSLKKENEELTDLLAKWEKAGKLGWGSQGVVDLTPEVQQRFGIDTSQYKYAIDYVEPMRQRIATTRNRISQQEYVLGLVTPTTVDKSKPKKTVGDTEDEKAAKGKWFGADMSKMFEVGSLADLEQQAAMVREAMKGATTVDEYKEMESHLNVILGQMKELRGEIDITFAPGSMNDLQQQLKEAQATLNGLAPDTEEWYEAFALVQSRQQAVNDLQDKMKVKVEETTSKFDAMRDAIGTAQEGIGAISELGNSFDDLKNIVEDLQYAFSGEMEAWGAMMTVFNSGVGVMQTVVNVMEAINTLSEFAAALSDIKIAKQQQETATVVAGKAAETAADLTEASASAASTGVTTGEAVSKAADSVAGIPVVGPVLAVAAAATVLGAILAAVMSARSSVGKFAEGGVVPGNSFAGDKLWAQVNSGEVILTQNQAAKVSNALSQRGNPLDSLHLETYISGEDIRIALVNNSKRRGISEHVATRR